MNWCSKWLTTDYTKYLSGIQENIQRIVGWLVSYWYFLFLYGFLSETFIPRNSSKRIPFVIYWPPTHLITYSTNASDQPMTICDTGKIVWNVQNPIYLIWSTPSTRMSLHRYVLEDLVCNVMGHVMRIEKLLQSCPTDTQTNIWYNHIIFDDSRSDLISLSLSFSTACYSGILYDVRLHLHSLITDI